MQQSTKWAIGIGALTVGALAYASYASAAKKTLALPAGTKVGKVDSIGVASYNAGLNVWTLPAVVSYAHSPITRKIEAVVARDAAPPPPDVVSAVFGATVSSLLFLAPPVIPADKVIGKILSVSNLMSSNGAHAFTVKIGFSDNSTQNFTVPVYDPATIAGARPLSDITMLMLSNFGQVLTAT